MTAGPTREYIDPVRFISNPATGTLGYSIAKEAEKRGHNVVLISGPSCLQVPEGLRTIFVESAIEMKKAVEQEFSWCDVLIMTAAVSDWRPEKRFNQKLKIKNRWTLNLVPNPDILKSVSKMKKKDQIVVGFALESENIIENARKKMVEKNLDIIVANTIENFGNPEKNSDIFVIYRDGKIKDCSSFTKKKLASFLIREIENIMRT